tara:strand:- start:913 stop:1242 length:330 start_codon:yes stop_codon:yes gene_type:complete
VVVQEALAAVAQVLSQVVLVEVVTLMLLVVEALADLQDRLVLEVEAELLSIQLAVHMDIRVVLALLLFVIKLDLHNQVLQKQPVVLFITIIIKPYMFSQVLEPLQTPQH